MKKVGIIILLISIVVFPKISPYVELNNLAIIESIGVRYKDENYTIWLKEVIPIKDEQGINYEYEYYKGTGQSIDKAYKEIILKTKINSSSDLEKILRNYFMLSDLPHSRSVMGDSIG